MNERRFRRGLITLVIAVVILTSVVYILPEPVRGASPTINYVSPADGATFVDVWRGEGVNLTVNVTDADGDLAQVVLKWNNSGTWATFYDSGALGGVSYHNVTVLNSNFTGSWETYEWQVCAKDGTGWANTTYSFTTEYVFGQPHLFAPVNGYNRAGQTIPYKNNTNDYWLFEDGKGIDVRLSSNGQDFAVKPIINTAVSGSKPYTAFTYNNTVYAYYYNYPDLNYIWYNGTAWHSGSILRQHYISYGDNYISYGADVIYYDGQWQIVAGYSGYTTLRYYISNTPLGSFTYIYEFHSGSQYSAGNNFLSYWMPSLEILGEKLVLTYIDNGRDLHWQVYDGAGWTDKGDIEADLGTSSSEIQGHWQSSVRDIANDQIVCVYINASGWLVYRVLTDPDGTWSDPVVLFKPASGYSIKYPYIAYYDRRLVITFQYNIRGNYETFVMFAPEYTEVTSGLTSDTLRIQFPDATPNQEHVNSTVFAIKNINDRPILNITWHVGDIGDIQTANNVRVWSNMSGSWQSWDVGADHNTSEIDISAVKGSEWIPGETLYWKLEILDVGAVPETVHIGHDIYYIVDLGT